MKCALFTEQNPSLSHLGGIPDGHRVLLLLILSNSIRNITSIITYINSNTTITSITAVAASSVGAPGGDSSCCARGGRQQLNSERLITVRTAQSTTITITITITTTITGAHATNVVSDAEATEHVVTGSAADRVLARLVTQITVATAHTIGFCLNLHSVCK